MVQLKVVKRPKRGVGRPRNESSWPRAPRGSLSRANMDIMRDREDDQVAYRIKRARRFSGSQSAYAFICIDGCLEEDGHPLFYTGHELDRAKAHQNFQGHQLVVIHEEEGKLGPLSFF